MDSKLTIFVVFVSLVQSCVAIPQTVDYGLSVDQLASLTQITVIQTVTVQANFDGVNPIFDIIQKRLSALIWNVEIGTDDESSKMAEALVRVKDAVDYFFNGVSLSLQKTCSVDDIQHATHSTAKDAYAAIGRALTLAQTGNYSANRAQLEKYRVKVQKALANLVSSEYGSIRSCLRSKDAATLSVLQWGQKGSGLGFLHSTNAIFGAIKVYTARVTAGTADVSLICKIEEFRRYAQAGVRSDVEYKFSIMKTLFIANQLDRIKISSGLALNQYARITAFYRFEASLQATFSAIYAGLEKITLGLYDLGNDDFSSTDAAQATAAAKFNAGNNEILASIHSPYPKAVAAAEKMLFIISTEAVATYFKAIEAALFQDTSPTESLNVIEFLKKSVISNARSYTDLFYNLFRNGKIWDAEFTTLQKEGTSIIETLVNNIFDAIRALAKAASAGKVSDADFITIQMTESAAISAADGFIQGISAAGVIILKADNTNYTGFVPDSRNAASAWSDASSKFPYSNRDHF